MIEIKTPGLDRPWYGVTMKFATPNQAYAAFVRVHEEDPSGHFNIGLYRHLRVGLDKGAVLLTAVGLDAEGVAAAEELMRGGEEIEMRMESWLGLIGRRAEIVLDLHAEGATSGPYRIEHSEAEL